jgi:hypothetical protein
MQAVVSFFAEHCIAPECRDRFIHEAAKRPDRLHGRICHHAAETFQPRFLSGSVAFAHDERCLFLESAKGFHESSWSEINRKTGLHGGLLVLSLEESKFYAESEGSPKVQVWAGWY